MVNNAFLTLSLFGMLVIAGCQEEPSAESANSEVPAKISAADATTETEASEKSHTHSEDDILVWVQSDIEDGDFMISLGHHGVHFHGGDEIEPAVTITRDGKDVADAVVFNSLSAEDGQTVLAEEKPTVFEPKTEDEPAHYAQGALLIPKDAKKYVIRFRIKLPGIDAESAYDIEQEISH